MSNGFEIYLIVLYPPTISTVDTYNLVQTKSKYTLQPYSAIIVTAHVIHMHMQQPIIRT